MREVVQVDVQISVDSDISFVSIVTQASMVDLPNGNLWFLHIQKLTK